MTIRFLPAVPRLAALRCALTLAACGLASAPSSAVERLQAWPARTPTPVLDLADQAGKTWQLDQLRGKVVLLHFWATWCESCVEELPRLNALAARAEAVGVVVLSINYKESAQTLADFSAAHPAPYPILRDRTGEAFKRFGGIVLPVTILIDRDGRARWRVNGALDGAGPAFDTALAKLTAPAH